MDNIKRSEDQISDFSPPAETPVPAMAGSPQPTGRDLISGEIVESRYKILSLVGRGGNGSVYKVEQILLKKHMALKTLNPVFVSELMLMRFQKEGQAASRLEHPNLVRAIDFGMIDGNQPFLVMDFVQGKPLSSYLRQHGSLSVQECLDIFIPVCAGMGYAHQLGVVHRDIKPGNIILIKGESGKLIPKVVDFGIAKLEIVTDNTEVQALTKTGEVFGTPLYMSPEQCAGSNVDNRSDIYSLGCVMFEALTGAPPFRGETALSTMMQHANTLSMSLKDASIGKSFSSALEMIVARMLEKDPAARYQSCEDLCQHLVWLQEGDSERIEQANRIKFAARAQKESSAGAGELSNLRKLLAICVSIFVVTAAIASVVAFWYVKQSESRIAAAQKAALEKSKAEVSPLPASDQSAPMQKEGYFSQLAGDARERDFKFPAGYSMGSFSCWDTKHRLTEVTDKGEVKIPVSSTVIYTMGGQIALEPYHAALFQNGDFNGLVIDCNALGQAEDDYIDSAANTLLPFTSLQSIWFKKTQLTESTFNKISDLPNLRWLCLIECRVTPGQIAHLKNINNVRVLALGHVDAMTPILKKLVRKPVLKRLMVEHTGMVDSDWSLLSQLHELDTLDLQARRDWHNFTVGDAQCQKTFECLAKLHKLQRLNISVNDIGHNWKEDLPAPFVTALKQMPQLKLLTIDHLPDRQLDQLQNALPHCEIGVNSERAPIEHWFDPRVSDPAIASK